MRSGDIFNVDDYSGYAGAVILLASESLRKLNPKKDEKILDVGCGDGVITNVISKKYGACVTGIDASAEMVRAAVRNGIRALQQDATNLEFKDAEFDKIYSNSALHWVADLHKALSEMSRVLKDGGDISLEFGRKAPPTIRNTVVEVAKKHGFDVTKNNPWNETSPQKLKKQLKQLGFENIKVETKSKLQSFPTGMKSWLDNFVSNTFLRDIPSDKKADILDQVVNRLKKFPNYFSIGDKPEWFGDYARICVTATLNKEKAKTTDRYINISTENQKMPGR